VFFRTSRHSLTVKVGLINSFTGFVAPANEVFSTNDDAFKNLLDQLNARGSAGTCLAEVWAKLMTVTIGLRRSSSCP
jgi:hypothetical protein